jgi:hypothetical protein
MLRVSWICGVLLIVGVKSVLAASPIYRCTESGQSVLTDKPCTTPTPAPSSSGLAASIGAPASLAVGDWSGQTQFQAAQSGQQIEGAQSVVPLRLTFSADGKVSGSSTDNGCKLLGLWSPGVTPRLFMLDITLSECRYSGSNRRYSGTLTTGHLDNSAQFSLQVYAVPIPGQPLRRYDVSATLRR